MFFTTIARRSLMNGTARAVSITSASIVFGASNVVTFASRKSGEATLASRSSRALETANSSSPHITRIMVSAYRICVWTRTERPFTSGQIPIMESVILLSLNAPVNLRIAQSPRYEYASNSRKHCV